MRRTAPRPTEVWRFVAPVFRTRPGGRLARVRTSEDFERLARRRTPGPVFDYVAGAAEGERSASRAVQAFDRVVFHPHVLRDVSAVDPSTTVLGRNVAVPVVLGPT